MIALGKLLISLCCRNANAPHNLQKSLEYVQVHYSQDLKNLIITLLRQPTTTEEVCNMISLKAFTEIDHLHNYTDLLESELCKEVDNGRIVRLLIKLGFINERPEFDMDPSWSETGDRYLLKLFRDYVFHQVNEEGKPLIDWGHVVECLNKIDIGTTEKILLMSRDEQSMLVVSYADLKRCMDTAFQELTQKQTNY